MDGAPTPGAPAGVAPPPAPGPDPAPAPAPAAPSAPAPEGGASGPAADDDATWQQRGGGGARGAASRPGPRPLLEDAVPLVAAPAGPVPEDAAAKAGKPRRMKRRTQEQKLEQEKGLIELGFRLLEPSLEPEAVGAEAAPSAAAALGGFLQQRWGKAGEYERLADEKRKQQEERERLAAAKRKQREQEQRERAVAEKRRLQELQDQRRFLREQKEAQKHAEEEGRRGAAASRLVAGGASPLVGLQDELRKQLGTAPALAPDPAPRPGALVLDKFAVPVGGLALRPPPRRPVPPGTAPVVDHAELLRKLKQRIAASTAARPQARGPRPAWDDDRDSDDSAGAGGRAAGPAKAATQRPASESTHSLYSQATVDDRWDREEGDGLAYLEAAAVFALQPGLDFGGGGFVEGMTAANFDAAAEWDAIEASLFPRADHGRKTRRPRHRGDHRKAAAPGAKPRKKKQHKEQPAAVAVFSAAGEDGKGQAKAKGKRTAAEAGGEAPYKKTYTSTAAQRRVPGAAVLATGQLAPCPFRAKNVEVLAWGQIVPGVSGPNLQSRQRHVWPVGFKSRRKYTDLATGNPEVRTEYVSETLQGGDGELLFRVTAVDGTTYEGATATAPWQQVLKAVNDKNQARSKVTVSGPQFFGLAIEPIFLQIRQLPGYAELAGGLL